MNFPLRQTIDLTGAWSLAVDFKPGDLRTIADVEASGRKIHPCQVPGNLELDLHAAGEIPEPFHGMNIATLRKYESAHAWYFRRFDCTVPAGTTPVFIFEGLDCFADVHLNGRLIGSSANALVEHSFPAEGLRATGNELVVHLRPVAEEAKHFEYSPGAVAQPNSYESLRVRKAPHAFGWDIMPRAVSAGIWRPVRLEFLPAARLDTVWLETTAADERESKLTLHFRTRLPAGELLSGYEITLEAVCGDSEFTARTPLMFEAGRIALTVKTPCRWWPRDRGRPDLYDVIVRLRKDGRELDRAEFRHGIRTVELRRTSLTDEVGRGEFCFLINGERVFMRGTNWVPADAYHSRDAVRLPRMLALLDECGCNMVRCWGGNVYEPAAFFDFCDEHGILVWQDFAMACAVYPQDDTFARVIDEEARKIIRRLRQHASLVCWAGDNECDRAYDWYRRGLADKNRLTREVIPRVLADEDPSRPYLPSSPWIDATAAPVDRRYLPEAHLWGPRDYFRSAYYAGSPAHFASEIGYHGSPAAASVRKFISPEKLWPPGNDEWLLHATSPVPGVELWDYRVELMLKQLREMFGTVPDNLDDFAWQSQCVQAEAKKFFIELFRGTKWRRTGILWWNLIDGWPQFSDAVVDYFFEKKLAFDFITRAQQPLLVMLREPQGWTQDLVACNDTREPIVLHYTVRDADSGQVLTDGSRTAAPDAVTVLEALPFTRSHARFLIIDWKTPRGSARNHYLAGDPPFDASRYRRWLNDTYFLPLQLPAVL
ncbi:MAG: glycoside hydrolase family 2 TIM barrel-domain containing protein [Opitutaceae bacterium]|nr:glycoside hydrolase family 2 TIM barrel-domain containing protein [Opitutaceae bacterium]